MMYDLYTESKIGDYTCMFEKVRYVIINSDTKL